MEISVNTERGWTVLGVTGRIDAHTSPEFEQSCRAELDRGVRRLAVDLAEVAYMSSAGLRVLLATLKRLSADDGEMVLLAPRANVREVLDVSGFSSLFRIEASRDQLA